MGFACPWDAGASMQHPAERAASTLTPHIGAAMAPLKGSCGTPVDDHWFISRAKSAAERDVAVTSSQGESASHF